MPLFKVKMEFETVVKADSPYEAMRLAYKQRVEIMQNDFRSDKDIPPGLLSASPILRDRDLPYGWDIDCIPWGVKTRNGYTMMEDFAK